MDKHDEFLLEGRHLDKSFGKPPRQVLFDVSVGVRPGECLAVIGGSGSGKSTLTRILLGLERADGGEVRFHGGSIATKDGAAALRRQSGVVYQNPFASLDPRWTVRRSVAEPLRLHDRKLDGAAVERQVRQALGLVSLDPDTFLDRYPMDLSGGQAQRVAIARAVITSPSVLLADEAMSAIDVAARLQILDAFAAIRERTPGMAMLMVSHDLGMVQHIADRILVIHDGHVVEEGGTQEVLRCPKQAYTQSLVEAATL